MSIGRGCVRFVYFQTAFQISVKFLTIYQKMYPTVSSYFAVSIYTICIDDPACFLTACVSQVHPGACGGLVPL